jgi:acyl-CoA synthetase (AMP-forming)/AMP-acid ligase II
MPGSKLIHSILDDAAARRPDATALRDARGAWTYAELVEQGRRCARWLLGRNLRRGDRVVVSLPARREVAAVLYGVSRIGATLVPVSVKLRPFQLRTVLDDADPALVLTGDDDLAGLRGLTDRPVAGIDTVWPQIQREPTDLEVTPPLGHDVALLLYTSGSSATPRAVVCPHAQVAFAARTIASRLAYRPDDVVLSCLPISFDYGLYQLLLSALATAELVLVGDLPGLAARLRSTGATVVPLLPPLAAMLVTLMARDPGPTAVRLITNTGATLAPAAIVQLRRCFPGAQIVLMFGLTECKRVSILEPDGDLRRPGSVGRPLEDTEVLVVDEAGRRLAPGEVGELVVKGPHVMAGYWRAPELTTQRFRRSEETGEISLHTGDYGHLDNDGHLYFQGRRDDVYKSQGVRVSTFEIEAAALDIPGVRQAVALPPVDGKDAVLYVSSDRGPAEVLRELALRLETAKVPRTCHVLETLPLTANGKADRQQLASQVRGPRP